MRRLRMLLATLAAMAVLAPTASAQQPVKIRVSWVAPVSNWASIMLEKKDLAKHLGKSYTMEPVRYAGTPPMVTALASGELEVANLAYSTLGIAIMLMYLVLVVQFGSFLDPLAILLSLPLSLIGVMLALLVTGSTLNIMSMIGVILLMGIVA